MPRCKSNRKKLLTEWRNFGAESSFLFGLCCRSPRFPSKPCREARHLSLFVSRGRTASKPRLVTKGKGHRIALAGRGNADRTGNDYGRRWQSARVAGSRKYLVLFVAVAILASVMIMWFTFNPLDPLAIPPGETRGRISVCYSGGPGGPTLQIAIDGIERSNVSMAAPRTMGCVRPLLNPGNHTVSVSSFRGGVVLKSWSTNVTLSSRQVVQLPPPGQWYSC